MPLGTEHKGQGEVEGGDSTLGSSATEKNNSSPGKKEEKMGPAAVE